MNKYLITILFLLNNPFAHSKVINSKLTAKECSTVNLTAKNQIYEDVPTYDQGGGQICYAYTAAQVIEGQRIISNNHKYSMDQSISPISLAISIALSRGVKNIQQGGVACKAIEHARSNRICPTAKSFGSAEEVEVLIQDFNFCKKNPNNSECIKKRQALSLSADIYSLSNPLIYVQAVESKKCKESDKIVLNIPPCTNINDESLDSDVFRKKVNTVFESKNPRPVEIGYSMHLFSYEGNEKEKYKIKRERENDVVSFSLKYKPHSSIILGRKIGKNGQCQYLLRNTQSASFCPLGIAQKRGWECDKKSGGIWINQSELFDSTFQVSHIEEERKFDDAIEEFIALNVSDEVVKCKNSKSTP